MQGILIVNHYLNTEKFNEINQWLLDAAQRQSVPLIKLTNVEIIQKLIYSDRWLTDSETKPDFILFWDKDIRLAELLESYGLKVFNSAKSIELCDDKAKTYTHLLNSGIRMPKTILVPMSYHAVQWKDSAFASHIHDTLGFPLILKECCGSFGEQVYFINSMNALIEKLNEISPKPAIIQEYIKSSHGMDIRLNVVGNEVVTSMCRYSTNDDFRANVTNGGKMKRYDPTEEQRAMALLSCEKLGLSFGGVDILFDYDGSPILCEVNSNAHFKNVYDCTHINVADYMISHIIQKIHA
jgi:RimK family alpha-L-glutamate ligase